MAELKDASNQQFSMIGKIKKYGDIYDEFCYWLENRNYDIDNPVLVNRYTARQIHELNPKLEGIGVYNFLIALREKSQRAEEYIKSRFKEL